MRSDEEILQARAAYSAETARIEAQALLDIRVDATNAAAWTDLGQCFSRRGLWEEAERHYDRALVLAPGQPYAHFNRSFSRMHRGDWEGAWEDFEHRRYLAQGGMRFPAASEWTGLKRADHIVLWGEQGVGDVLQWARNVKWVGCPATLEVPNCLVRLMVNIDGVDDVWARPKDDSKPYEVLQWQLPLGSLSHVMWRTKDPARLIVAEPYITGIEPNVTHAGKVFYCHSGSPKHQNDAMRSATGSEAQCLKDAGYERLHLGDPACGHDFLETAQNIAGCKAVVTVDTALAHLAGAMGVKCFLVPPLNGEGRWGGNEDGSNDLYGSVTVVHPKEGFAKAFEQCVEKVSKV